MDRLDTAAFALLVVAVLLFLGRKLSLWYFRISETVGLLQEIRDQLRKANGESIAVPTKEPVWPAQRS